MGRFEICLELAVLLASGTPLSLNLLPLALVGLELRLRLCKLHARRGGGGEAQAPFLELLVFGAQRGELGLPVIFFPLRAPQVGAERLDAAREHEHVADRRRHQRREHQRHPQKDQPLRLSRVAPELFDVVCRPGKLVDAVKKAQ